ncbi:threonine aldolase family protein [Marinicella sp. W31]|uniref:threonine aldolase family protein n=1 Tax=Marinicella sp. W31 TaxID=3023713 RepID=UPI0037576500
MDKVRRSIMIGLATMASGVSIETLANQNKKTGSRKLIKNSQGAGQTKEKLEKSMLDLKYDLAFPSHHQGSSYLEKLTNIQNFMRSQGLKEEQYCRGDAITQLEDKIANLFGKEAALWCPTGTLAQSIAIRIHGEKTGRKKLQMHPSCHILIHENRGFERAHGFTEIVSGKWRETLSADHVDPTAACMVVEMGQRHSGGLLPGWHELQALKQRAKMLEVPLHMDGARIWSTRQHYNNRSLAEISDGFSSVYVSFYKDIGAIGGAALIGDADFIMQARDWRERLGGLVSEHWPQVCDTLRLLDKKLIQVENNVGLAKKYAQFISSITDLPVFPKVPQVNLFHVLLPYTSAQAKQAHLYAAQESGIWLTNAFWNYENPNECAMEITINETASIVPEHELNQALSIFFKHLDKIAAKT